MPVVMQMHWPEITIDLYERCPGASRLGARVSRRRDLPRRLVGGRRLPRGRRLGLGRAVRPLRARAAHARRRGARRRKPAHRHHHACARGVRTASPHRAGVDGGQHGLFVDAVAAEVVELGAQQVARRQRVGSCGGASSSPPRRTPSSPRARSARIARRSRDCEPAAQERRLGARAADADLLLADPGPAAGERHAPAHASAPTRCPRRPCARSRRRARGSASSSHSDESTTTRSATPTSCSHCVLAERRLAAPAQEDRQVGDRQREHDRRRRLRPVAAQLQLDHLAAHGAVAGREAAHRELGVDARPPRRAAARGSPCATDAAPPSPRASARPRRATAAAPRRRASSRSCAGAAAGPRRSTRRAAARARASISAIVTSSPLPRLEHGARHQCRRQERPSRCSSSSADGGPHVPAA